MSDYKKSLYNVSIDGQGYILSGIPTAPARIMKETSIVGTFPTVIDNEYKDSSQFLPWAQTDWSGGFQFEKWSDNAGFKNGSGIEYIEKFGEITLLNNISSTLKDFGAGFTFGAAVEYDRDTVGLLIGVTKGSGASELWKMSTADSFTQITGGTWANVDAVHSMDELQGKAYIGLNVSAGNPLKTYDGSAVADITLTNALASSKIVRMVKRIETRLYVGGYTGTAANGDALAYSDDEGTTWTNIITKLGKGRQISEGVSNLGTLYFLVVDGSRTELWWCNDTIVTQIYRWEDLTSPRISSWLGRVYIEGKENGKLMRFEWNGATLRNIFEERISGLDLSVSPMIVYKNNLHSYGLVYDGLFHFPSHIFKYSANKIYPFAVFGNGTTEVPYFYGLSTTNLIITKLNTSAYLTTGNVITGIFNGGKPAVDKIWHSVTLSFKVMVASQTIKVEYSLDDEATWVTIDTISPTAGEIEKTLYFANNIKGKRIQLKLTLTGGGSNTPTVYDIVTRFLSKPDNRMEWTLKLNCSDKLMLLDGKTFEKMRSSELRYLLMRARFDNNIVSFQDIDFAETAINAGAGLTATATSVTVDSTNDFPEQGRIKIDQEEILYTGKTITTFTGLTRGARGTKKETHADNATISNAYNVVVANISEKNRVAIKPKSYESEITIALQEV